MDINNNMEIENFEMVIDGVFEGDSMNVNPDLITEEMVMSSIKKNINRNRILNRSVSMAVYDLVRNDLAEYTNNNVRGM